MRRIIKICGLREADNIRAVETLDIDWTGFIFYPPSPRCVPDEEHYADAVRKVVKRKAGVFVNAGLHDMLRHVSRFQLDGVQLHGDESPETSAALRQAGCTVIKAFAIASEDDLRRTEAFEGAADYFLFDTKCNLRGGSGQRFDWQLCEAYQGRTPFLLSGGIRPQHTDDVLRFTHPRLAGIDLNSGFETAPAQKDVAVLQMFINEIRKKEMQ
jgi:phosphoribosylanthranilate isomerase